MDDQQLLVLFEEDAIEHFIDFLADYVAWGKPVPKKLKTDTSKLLPLVKTLYARLLEKIKIS